MRHLKCKYIISYTALKALKRRVYPSFLPSFWKGKLIVCSVIYVIGENTVIIVLIHYYFIFKDNIHLTNHSTLRLRYIGKHHPVFCTYFVLYFVQQVPKVDWCSRLNKPRRVSDGYNPWIFCNPSSVVNFFGKMEKRRCRRHL